MTVSGVSAMSCVSGVILLISGSEEGHSQVSKGQTHKSLEFRESDCIRAEL